jgi:hypothetical protein
MRTHRWAIRGRFGGGVSIPKRVPLIGRYEEIEMIILSAKCEKQRFSFIRAKREIRRRRVF